MLIFRLYPSKKIRILPICYCSCDYKLKLKFFNADVTGADVKTNEVEKSLRKKDS